jgi:pyrrolidone-carboxylate peptidase
MKKLLLTAFEPFAGEIVNPSLEVARVIGSMHVANAQVEKYPYWLSEGGLT